jgi:hypothetical protein
VGLGRHGRIDDSAGDPLDGLVNLFDLGIVLAVAFLVAGLSLTVDSRTGRVEARQAVSGPSGQAPKPAQPPDEKALPDPARAPAAEGRGQRVGSVYRTPDGRLIYVEK